MAKQPVKPKAKGNIGRSGEMVGGPPRGKGQMPTKGKKPSLKIDIMLAKAMPTEMPMKKGTMPIDKKQAKKSGMKKGK